YWHPLLNAWVLTRYADIQAVLRDRRFSSQRSDQFANGAPPHMLDKLAVCDRFLSMWMAFLDPPRHTVLRSLLGKAFTMKVVEGLRPFVERAVDEMLDAAVAAGEMDIVKDLAVLLPAMVIARMLGIPGGDIGRVKAHTNEVLALLSSPAAT